ncbi:MAG: hypothetical protein KDJ29_14900 [Hyphomicrobiales bacterium]|nr:hypothetical protein [Nitratireductor sp.]MCC2098182.1 hypothetical protein [Hyphomicrobiales bacterium]
MTLRTALRDGLVGAALAVLMAVSATPAMSQQAYFGQGTHPVPQNHRTYLVNGLASVMPFIGYGFANLKAKLGDAKHYSYATPVEGRLVVQPLVLSEIRREFARDPSVQINLVGISYGGNIVTSLAAELYSEGIPVNYLGVLDGPVLAAIPPNVHRVDNFICRIPGCIGSKVRLTKGNNVTLHTEFKYTTTHVGLGDFAKVHNRIIGQLTAYPMLVAGHPIETVPAYGDAPGIDPLTTASIQ